MPSIFTQSPAEIERKEPGIGGKPPVDRRPTGGGGGGGDDDWKNRTPRTARAPPARPFLCLLRLGRRHDVLCRPGGAVFRAPGRHAHGPAHPRADRRLAPHPAAAYPLPEYRHPDAQQPDHGAGAAHIFREIDVLEEWLGLGRPALPHFALAGATLVLGGLFLAGQVAWKQLTAQGFAFDRFSTPASYFFYVITGLHAAT